MSLKVSSAEFRSRAGTNQTYSVYNTVLGIHCLLMHVHVYEVGRSKSTSTAIQASVWHKLSRLKIFTDFVGQSKAVKFSVHNESKAWLEAWLWSSIQGICFWAETGKTAKYGTTKFAHFSLSSSSACCLESWRASFSCISSSLVSVGRACSTSCSKRLVADPLKVGG